MLTTPPAGRHAAAGVGRLARPRRTTRISPRATSTGCGATCWASGIIEPLDDIRAGNPPTNPELLDYLTAGVRRASGFDVRHVLRLICKSRTYQLSIETNNWNEDDKINYSHAIARRLPAEVLYDAIYRVTGSVSQIPGRAAGDAGGGAARFGRRSARRLPDDLRPTGRGRAPASASGPAAAARAGHGPGQRPDRGRRPRRPANELTQLVAAQGDDAKLIDELFLRDPQPAGDPRGDRRPAARTCSPSRRTTAGWPRSSAVARPSSP